MLQKPNTTTKQSATLQEALTPDALSLGAAEQAQIRRWLQWLNQALSLPGDWISFAMFAMVLAVLGTGLMLHIHLSSQIYRTQLEIGEMEIVYDRVAHQNTELIWQISQFTSLNSVRQRAEAMGYAPATQQYYVAESSVQAPRAFAVAAPEVPSTGTGSAETAPESQMALLQANVNTVAASSASLNAQINSSQSPVWTVRMQQRMAHMGQWVQSWWQ